MFWFRKRPQETLSIDDKVVASKKIKLANGKVYARGTPGRIYRTTGSPDCVHVLFDKDSPDCVCAVSSTSVRKTA